jgi:serine/threonine protein kinase/ABC-type phosphate/phosphonate transport system substrate-binding protein
VTGTLAAGGKGKIMSDKSEPTPGSKEFYDEATVVVGSGNQANTAPTQTLLDGEAPKNRGVRASDYSGPSYSELKRQALNKGEIDNRLALPIGFQLQEYTIERILGIGGFGVSYLAHDANLNAKVAIKEYLPNQLALRAENEPTVMPKGQEYVEDYEKGLDRFLMECRTLATFRHPNIVRVSRFFEANHTAYMVMEYEFGESLNSWVKKRTERGEGAPNEELLLKMFLPMLQGLEVVHKGGFTHRDIKPANIYVRDSDGSMVLLDFGAARQAVQQGQQALTAIVTPGYAPFEQYHSHGRQGPWSDIYAVGGVLYWCVAGEKPVEAAARLQTDPQQPAAVRCAGKYSERFLKAIDWALQPDDTKRPQSVSAFVPVLEGIKEATPVAAAKTSKPWLKWAVGGAVAAAVAVGAATFLMKPKGPGAGGLMLGVMPGTSGATEEVQVRASLAKFSDVLSKAVGKPVTVEVTSSFAPDQGAKDAKFDMILGATYPIGVAARDYKYSVVGKFRDVMALFVVRIDAPMDRIDDIKGTKLGLHTRNGMVGPMAARVLNSSNLPLDATSFKGIEEFKSLDDMTEALVNNKVDVIALSPGGFEEAEKRFPNKIKLLTSSDPLPGYAIALRERLDPQLALKITSALYAIDENDAGKAALKTINLGSAAGSLEIKQATSREYVRAAEAIEAARKFFPAPK